MSRRIKKLDLASETRRGYSQKKAKEVQLLDTFVWLEIDFHEITVVKVEEVV